MIVNVGLRRFQKNTVNRALAGAGFFAPLKSSLTLGRGTGSATSIRAGATATVVDFEGNVLTTLANEARFTGARRVANLITASEDFNNAAWTKIIGGSGTIPTVTSGFTDPSGGATAWRVQANRGAGNTGGDYSIVRQGSLPTVFAAAQLYIKSNNGSDQQVAIGNNTPINVTTSWTLFSYGGVSNTVFDIGTHGTINTTNSVDILVWHPQFEDVTNQSNQAPADHVPSTWNDTGAAGVRNFEYLNGNTVTNNVVTQAQGAPIPTATLLGYLSEAAATNLVWPSGYLVAGVTQTTAALTAVPYTLSFKGTGSVTGTGGFVGTLNGTGATNKVQLTVTATAAAATLTVTGSITEMQLELGSFATSNIPTTTVAVTRNADVDSYPTAGNIVAAQGTIYGEFTPNHAPSGTIYLWGTYVDANNSTAILHDATNLIFRKRIAGVNYDATIANAFVSGTKYKWAASFGAAGTAIVLNGTVGTPNANTTSAQIAATMQEGADGNGAGQPTAQISNRRDWQTQLPNATLQALTT